MISADVVAQVMSVTQVTQTTKITMESFSDSGKSGGCCRSGQNDFTAILEDIAARSANGVNSNPLLSLGIQDGETSQALSSDMIGFFAGLISGDEQTESGQSPFDFIQSLSMQQRTTYQSFDYMSISSTNSEVSFEEAKTLLHRVANTFGNRGSGEFGMDAPESQWQFPPTNAPQEVMDAWDKVSSEASEEDLILVSGMFIGLALGENMEKGRMEHPPPPRMAENSQESSIEEIDQYWQQVKTLLELIDQALERSPERESEIDGAKGVLVNFLDELNEAATA